MSNTPAPQTAATQSAHAVSSDLARVGLGAFLEATASKAPTPGGGSVCGVVGAFASALGQMCLAYSLGRKSLVQHQPLLVDADGRLSRARAMLLELAMEDARAYSLVNELSKLPEGDPGREGLAEATLLSTRVPHAIGATALDVLGVLCTLAGTTNHHLRSDLAIAAVLAEATVRAARWNVAVNLPGITDAHHRAVLERESGDFVARARSACDEIERACEASW